MWTRGKVAGALVALASLGGCSGVDMDAAVPAMEQEIATEVEDQSGARGIEVDCPDEAEWRTGETFRCVVEDGRHRAFATVHMESDAGEYAWSVGR